MKPSDPLLAAALVARELAFAPFSKFKVGAAVAALDGRIHSGCNVENATYGLTMCAERVAIFKAISEGERRFDAISVVTDTDTLTPPCGACCATSPTGASWGTSRPCATPKSPRSCASGSLSSRAAKPERTGRERRPQEW